MYSSETMIWREKGRSRIKVVQMDIIRGLLGIKRMYRVTNARIRELCGVAKWLDERIDESVLHWFGHIERKIGLLKGGYVGIRLVGRLRKRWIDSVNDCLKKSGMNVGEDRECSRIGVNGGGL